MKTQLPTPGTLVRHKESLDMFIVLDVMESLQFKNNYQLKLKNMEGDVFLVPQTQIKEYVVL